MAFVPGKYNAVTYNFTGGSVTIYAPNREYASVLLHQSGLMASEDAGSQLHTVVKTKHKSFGALTSITLP